MESIIEYQLKDEIFSEDYEYFFSFLADRFEYATELWIKELEKKFNKKFKPIWVLSARQNDIFMDKKENYIIINKKLKEIKKNLKSNKVIYLQDYEDQNKEFSESKFIKDLIERVVHRQKRVFILGFTSSCLDIKNSNAIILGPNPSIATKFDNKIEHVKLFEKLDLPRNNTKIYSSIKEVKDNEKYPLYISASYTSGGHESGTIFSESDLDTFFSKLRNINKSSHFLVSDLISDIKVSPNVNAVICGQNDTRLICISDQILRGNQYLGNIYPSKISEKEKELMIKATKKVGDYLANLGFRGLFGLDFIVDSKGRIYCVDLNPRRQGGYLCNILMSKKINIPEIELKLSLGEEAGSFNYDDFQANFVWAHSKIKPYFSNTRITNQFNFGEPPTVFNKIGSEYRVIFYPEKSLLIDGSAGYIIIADNSYEKIKEKIIKETEILISKNFEVYEGL